MLRATTLPEGFTYSISLEDGAELYGLKGGGYAIVDASGAAAVLSEESAARLHTVLSARLGKAALRVAG